MKSSLPTIAILLITLAGGCAYSSTSRFSAGSVDLTPTQPAPAEAPDKGEGPTRTTYQFKSHPYSNEVKLVAQTVTVTPRSFLGVHYCEIDKKMAREKNLQPYQGLFLEKVDPGSPADKAGLLPGDILVKMNGTDTLYRETLAHILDGNRPPSKPITVTLLRGLDKRVTLVRIIPPLVHKVDRLSTKVLRLETPITDCRVLAGMAASNLPGPWSARIYGAPEGAVLISKVEIGSPAYLAGLRHGDRVLTAFDQPINRVEDLHQSITSAAAAGKDLDLQVWQPEGGKYQARISLENYSGKAQAHIPLVLDYKGDSANTDWQLGPFGWIVEYDGRYLNSSTREANYRRSFSCLLDMFSAEWTPKESTVRLFWIIKFRTR